MVEKPEERIFIVNLGNRIKVLRESRGLSSSDMARALYMERGNYSRIETGKTNPTIITLFRISQALGVSVEEIFRISES